MRLIADENLPLLPELFAGHEVIRLPGRAIRRSDLQGADALLVRSVTRVDRRLLDDTPVRFVGTATIGTDHIDLAALADLGVRVASAPGCNARAVGEYVATALAMLAAEQDWEPAARTLGVIGLGNTGRQAAALATALGFRVVGCDPYVRLPGIEQLGFRDLLARADILSFHVPLSRGGSHPTWHLMDAAALAGLPAGAILINACRGEVVEGAALLATLSGRPDLTAVLDVWEGEPGLVSELLEAVRFGTPHVAGYSQEGKWRGTEMVYQAFCECFGLPMACGLDRIRGETGLPGLGATAAAPARRLAEILGQACPIARDDGALRQSMASADRGAAFDALRRNYPARREFTAHRLALPAADPLWPVLRGLGFRSA